MGRTALFATPTSTGCIMDRDTARSPSLTTATTVSAMLTHATVPLTTTNEPFSTVSRHAIKELDAMASSSRSTTTATRSAGSTTETWTLEPRYGVDTRLAQSASVLHTNLSLVETAHLIL